MSLLDEYEIKGVKDYNKLPQRKKEQFSLGMFKIVRGVGAPIDDEDFSPYLRFLHILDGSSSNFSQIVKRSSLYSGHTFLIENTPIRYKTSTNDDGTFFQGIFG